MAKKAIIAVVVVVIVVVVIAAIAFGGSSSDKSPEVRYDYTLETSDIIVNPDYPLAPSTPSSGMEYAILTVMYANDHYADGIDTNPLEMVWTITVDGIGYSTSADMFTHPGYQLIDIGEGATGTCVYVFEVPEGTPVEDMEVSLDIQWTFDPPTIERDDSLL